MATWKVEYLDRVHDNFFEEEEHDRLVRCVLTFENSIDVQRFQAALAKCIDESPILNTTYVENEKSFVWNSRGAETSGIFFGYGSQTAMFTKLLSPLDPVENPQIRFCCFANMLGVVVNNMLMDIYGVRNLIAYIVDTYNHINTDGYVSPYKGNHGRGLEEFLSTVPFSHKCGKSKLNKLKLDGFNKTALPFSPIDPSQVNPWITSHIIYSKEGQEIFKLASKINVSVADVLLAAYFRTIAYVTNSYEKPLEIGRFYDARPESNDKGYISRSSLNVILPYSIIVKNSDSFATTLKNVGAIDGFIAKHHLVAKKISGPKNKIFNKSDYFQFVDVGGINASAISFNDNPIVECFMLGAQRNIPFFAVSSCYTNGNIHLGAANFCNQEDVPNIQYFLDYMHYEIKNWVGEALPDFYAGYDPNQEEIVRVTSKQVDFNNTSTYDVAKNVAKGKKASKTTKNDGIDYEHNKLAPIAAAPVAKMPEIKPSTLTPTDITASTLNEPVVTEKKRGFWTRLFTVKKKQSAIIDTEIPKGTPGAPLPVEATSSAISEKKKGFWAKHKKEKPTKLEEPVVAASIDKEVPPADVFVRHETPIVTAPTPLQTEPVVQQTQTPVVEVPIEHHHKKVVTKKHTTKKVTHKKSAKKHTAKKPTHKHVAKKIVHKPIHHAAHSTHETKGWTAEETKLAAKYLSLTGSHLVPVEGDSNKVKYKIKGKNTFQKRTWAEIKKFVNFKEKNK